MAVVYKRLALCEVVETDQGQLITLKIEKPIDVEELPLLFEDELYESHLYTKLDQLREDQNYVSYHHFCEYLIAEYVKLREGQR